MSEYKEDTVSFRVPKPLHDEIKKYTKETNQSKSNAIRELIKNGFNHNAYQGYIKTQAKEDIGEIIKIIEAIQNTSGEKTTQHDPILYPALMKLFRDTFNEIDFVKYIRVRNLNDEERLIVLSVDNGVATNEEFLEFLKFIKDDYEDELSQAIENS